MTDPESGPRSGDGSVSEDAPTAGFEALPGRRLGPYEVGDSIGAGGMGEVYRARDTRLGRDVAVKILRRGSARDTSRLALFEREARAVAALNHPNVVTVHDVGASDDVHYVVTELLEGETLRGVASRRKPTARQVLGYAVQAARGLAAAHAKGIVHRDLKPENLFLTVEGRVKVLDFGLAKLEAPPRGESEATRSATGDPGRVMGTVAYMSPEQARGESVDARSDVFSFGVVLYELLTGGNPFRRGSVGGTLAAILEETPAALDESVTGTSGGAGVVVGRCLEKEREERYASGRELLAALEALVGSSGDGSGLVEVEERSPYPGLQSYSERDARYFFGREREVEELWSRLRAHPLLALIGPSGAGKSSFLRAGVVARRPEGWGALLFTPGSSPLRSFARALGPALASDREALAELVDFEDTEVAVSLVSRWRRRHGECVVVVDQLEELFTQSPAEVQESFSTLLGRVAAEAGVHVLLSLRDDFLIRCHEQPALHPVFEHLTPLLPPGGEALRRAVVEPARQQGYRFEDEGLTEELLRAVSGARAPLPLLAFALSRLWSGRDRGSKTLTRGAYEALGGVSGALAQHAEATLGRIGTSREAVVREIFRNLVTAEGTRTARDRDELLSVFESDSGAAEVLDALTESRLLTEYEEESPGGGGGRTRRVEIAHESLLEAWPRLVRWRTQDADGAQLRDQLRQAARLWSERGESDDLLWSGQPYRDYALWRERYEAPLTPTEEAFARASEARTARSRRRRQAAVTLLTAAATAVAVVTSVLWRRSEGAVRRAEASRLLALAQLRLEDDPTEALAWATASLELHDSAEARLFTLGALAEGPPGFELREVGQYIVVRFSPDGRYMAASGRTPEVRVFPRDGGPPVVLGGHRWSPDSPVLSCWASNDRLVTLDVAPHGARAQVWRIPEGERARTLELESASRQVWHAEDDELFVRLRDEQADPPMSRFRVWRLQDGDRRELGQLASSVDHMHGVFAPGGRGWIYHDGAEVLMQPLPIDEARPLRLGRHVGADGVEGFRVRAHPPQLFSVARDGGVLVFDFSEDLPDVVLALPPVAEAMPNRILDPTLRWVADGFPTPQSGSLARVWDLNAWPGSRPLSLRRGGNWGEPTSEFHIGGAWIAVASRGALGLWPLGGGWPVVVDHPADRSHKPLAFSPGGGWLATAGSGAGELMLRPLPGNGAAPRTLAVPEAPAWTRLVFDAGERFLFAVAHGDRAWVVPLDGSPPRTLPGVDPSTMLKGAAVSPSGRRVATAPLNGLGPRTLRVWDLETGERRLFDLPESSSPASNPAAARQIRDLGFADETTLYTAGDGGVRRWDLANGTHDLVYPTSPGNGATMTLAADARTASIRESPVGRALGCGPVMILDLATGAVRPLPAFGVECTEAYSHFLDASGRILATSDDEGVVRVGLVSGGEPHLLLGHAGPIESLAISPDGRWLASGGSDGTLRLWPLPDLSKPAPHALPVGELLARLRAQTNVRVVRDADSPQGWTSKLDRFPGWAAPPEPLTR